MNFWWSLSGLVFGGIGTTSSFRFPANQFPILIGGSSLKATGLRRSRNEIILFVWFQQRDGRCNESKIQRYFVSRDSISRPLYFYIINYYISTRSHREFHWTAMIRPSLYYCIIKCESTMLRSMAANVIEPLVIKFVIRITSSWTCRPVSRKVLRAIKSSVNGRCVSVGVFRILNPEIYLYICVFVRRRVVLRCL